MTPRAFLSLTIATALGVVAAIGTVITESRIAGKTVVVDEPFFPALVERANDVARVTYRTPAAEAVVEWIDGAWRFASKNNYPVQSGNVRSVVANIASLRRLEPKTSDPEKYRRLSVQPVSEEGADSRELILETAEGLVLAAVVIGRTSNVMQFDPLGGTYIREIGDATSWLVRGTVALPPSTVDFMERQIIHVPGPEIRSVQIWENGQSVLNVEKYEDDRGVLRYGLVPTNEEIRATDSAVKQLASGIVSLNFEDVRPATDIAFPDAFRQISFSTYDGIELTLRVAQLGEEEAWITVDVTFEPDAEGIERAQEILSATAGWAFLLPSHKLAALTRDAGDLTQPIPDPEAPAVGPQLPPGLGAPGANIGRPTIPGVGRR